MTQVAETSEDLEAQQARLDVSFVGSLMPWLIDSLSLFSIFAVECASRLLPLVLPLLNTIKPLLAADFQALVPAAESTPPKFELGATLCTE